jgi:two-component system nitrogen regulation response regulator GlnG
MLDESERVIRMPQILVIDDDKAMLTSLGRVLRTEDFGDPLLCNDPREAEGFFKAHEVGTVLLDLVMPHISGEVLLESILAAQADIPVIVVTATDQIDTAVRCVKAGAFDYLVKPVDFSRLIAVIARALQQRNLRVENRRLQDLIRAPHLCQPECFTHIITQSPAMHALFRYVEAIAPSSEPVLITGETGVGKELVAQALHKASRRPGEMVSVNVAGIDETSFADTLFGHVKGAFTGADRDRKGMIEQAGEGTLFLDEIGDLGVDMQTKLLRVLQEGEFFALGSDRCQRSRCRILAATNCDLRIRMRNKRFREDLYYRLHGHLIRVPPLRERTGDISLLVEHFLRDAAAALGKPVPTIPKELPLHLMAYAFPGNVRELRIMVVDAVAQHENGILSLASFNKHMDHTALLSQQQDRSAPQLMEGGLSFGSALPTLARATQTLVTEALKRTNGNQGAAARLLGISRRTINRHVNDQFCDIVDKDP